MRLPQRQQGGFRFSSASNSGNNGPRIAPLTKNPDVKEVITAAKEKADGGVTAKGEDQRRSAEVEGCHKMCIGHAQPDTRAASIYETQLWSGD
ncbi:hypothetical protein J7337_013905 [Fusarium musae]|uniref:Uncharacterized protein n=1 Tax=Fusarium musae TaxID=1042133 RepID=A0A9P8IA69_9HYPO|nr:hypothetical protein J7337_013905 [Fusarium musae]KAG9494766.1 hypothetical protein J7337_013905 [Fusarium musae]